MLHGLFIVHPELKDIVPTEFQGNAYHLVMPQESVPFTCYYVLYQKTKIVVTSLYSLWFECRYCNGEYEVHCLARDKLKLPQHPLPGINFNTLFAISEVHTRPPTLAPEE